MKRVRLLAGATALALGTACSDSGPPAKATVDRILHTCFNGGSSGLDICAVDVSGENRVTIIGKPTDDEHASWSPDWTRIAFTSFASGARLFTANADGSGQAPLGVNVRGRYPTWSPDGSKIAFADVGLWIINPDGSGMVRIVDDTNGADRPTWAPNGARIVFGTLTRIGGGKGILAVNPNGTGLQALTTGPQDSYPAYSPDGSKIAYTVWNTGIAVMNADGTNRDTILLNAAASLPSWSPNGQEIVYNVNGAPIKLWIMSASGANPRLLSTGNPNGDMDPAWGRITR